MLGNQINPLWDTSKASICGLDQYCPFTNGEHYYLKHAKVVTPADPEGIPVYGIQYSYIGVITADGAFIATRRRDHLVGKPLDRELLDDPSKLAAYVRTAYHL